MTLRLRDTCHDTRMHSQRWCINNSRILISNQCLCLCVCVSACIFCLHLPQRPVILWLDPDGEVLVVDVAYCQLRLAPQDHLSGVAKGKQRDRKCVSVCLCVCQTDKNDKNAYVCKCVSCERLSEVRCLGRCSVRRNALRYEFAYTHSLWLYT